MENIVASIYVMNPFFQTDDLEYISQLTKTFEDAQRLIYLVIHNNGGYIVGNQGPMVIASIPLEKSECLRDLLKRMVEELDLNSSIGVAERLSEANKAAQWAFKNAPKSIKVYTPDLDEEKEESILPGLQKSEDSDLVSPESKQKILQIIQQLKENKELFNQIKSQSPDVYQGIVMAIMSFNSILNENQATTQQTAEGLATKVKAALEKEHSKKMERLANQIQSRLDREHKKHTSNKKESALSKIKEYNLNRRNKEKQMKQKMSDAGIEHFDLLQELAGRR